MSEQADFREKKHLKICKQCGWHTIWGKKAPPTKHEDWIVYCVSDTQDEGKVKRLIEHYIDTRDYEHQPERNPHTRNPHHMSGSSGPGN